MHTNIPMKGKGLEKIGMKCRKFGHLPDKSECAIKENLLTNLNPKSKVSTDPVVISSYSYLMIKSILTIC